MSDGGRDVHGDGAVLDGDRQADVLAIRDLAIAYGHAVDDQDWARWTDLFTPDAHVDYVSAGGIAGTRDEVAAWMPGAMSVFTFGMHSMSTHEIRFPSADGDEATGRVHVFNRNGVDWEGEAEIIDVGAVYHDDYRRVGDVWRFSRRIERVQYIVGGRFAEMVRDLAASATSADTDA